MATETLTNTNIEHTTRRLWKKTIVSQVLMKMAILARLLLARRMSWEGGKFITAPLDKAEMDDLAQSYTAKQALTAERKTMTEMPYFHWKYNQVPVSYDIEENLMNAGGPGVAPVKFIKFLVKKAHRATRLHLYRMMYAIVGGVDSLGNDDHSAHFQSVRQALDHDRTYGHLSRATTVTNSWWQGASAAETFADQDTEVTWSYNTWSEMFDATQIYAELGGGYLTVTGPALFRKLKREVMSWQNYPMTGKTRLARFGFHSMEIDGVEYVKDQFLRNSVASNAHKWAFNLHINDYELRLHPQRSFAFTGFKWQGDVADGYDEWLGRIMTAGNFVCWKPNESIWRSNVV